MPITCKYRFAGGRTILHARCPLKARSSLETWIEKTPAAISHSYKSEPEYPNICASPAVRSAPGTTSGDSSTNVCQRPSTYFLLSKTGLATGTSPEPREAAQRLAVTTAQPGGWQSEGWPKEAAMNMMMRSGDIMWCHLLCICVALWCVQFPSLMRPAGPVHPDQPEVNSDPYPCINRWAVFRHNPGVDYSIRCSAKNPL